MKVSTFTTQRDNNPGRGDITWAQLVNELARPRPAECTLATCTRSGWTLADGTDVPPCPHKSGLSWSPASWPVGATRKVWNVEEVCVLVIDLDHVKPSELAALLTRVAPFRIVVHASHSDRPDDRCLRIVVALSRPVAGPDWPRFWTAAMQMLALPADPRCKDGSRLYYLPSRPSDGLGPAQDGSGYAFGHQDGAALDVDAILAAAPPAEVVEYEEYEIPEFAGAPPVEKLAEAAKALAGAWPSPGQNRHDAHLALSGALARAGWPAELIAEFAAAVAHTSQPGNADMRKRLGAARSSVEKAQIGAPIKGWPTLQQILDAAGRDGRSAVETATELLGMRRGPRLDDTEVADFAASLVPTTDNVVGDMMGGMGFAPPAPAPMSPPMPAPMPIAAPAASGPTTITLESHVKAVQRTLASRKDPDSIRDAEYLRRIERGEPLTDDPAEDQVRALAFGTLALARAVPAGTTSEQITRRMVASAGVHVDKLPQLVGLAMKKAQEMVPLTSRTSRTTASGEAPLDEFVLKKSGDDQGQPVPNSQHNFRVAMNRLGVAFRFNQFSCNEIIIRESREEVAEDHHLDALAFECEQKFQFYPPVDKWNRFCSTLAREDSYHPVLDYINSLPADQPITDLTETWLIRFGGAPDTEYVRAVSRLVLVAAVRRVRQPGCKFDEMLILETPKQGKNKSSALRALCPNEEWFTDDFRLDANDTRKMMESTSGRWIIEAGELKGMSTGLAADMKQYLSRREDVARVAYGRKPRRIARQFIIIGTTNEDEYLRDQTGNRRYWPVRVVEFDVKALLAHRDQLWAEAARLDLENPEPEYIRLDPSLYEAAAREQEARAVIDPYEIVLAEAFGGVRGRIPVADVWKLVGFHEENLPSKTETMQISSAMTKLGFVREHLGDGRSGMAYFYVRADHPEERELSLQVVGNSGSWRVRPAVPRESAPASQMPPRDPLADQPN